MRFILLFFTLCCLLTGHVCQAATCPAADLSCDDNGAVQSDETLLPAELSLPATDAYEAGQTETGSWQFSLALGYGMLENPLEQAKNTRTLVLPSWHYYSDRFYLDNFSLGYSLLESRDLEIDLQTRVNDDGLFYELNGLAKLLVTDLYYKVPLRQPVRRPGTLEKIERKVSYLGGLVVTFPNDWMTVSLGHFQDLSSVHQGAETTLRLNQIYPFFNGRLGVEAGWTRKNTALVDYYYRLTPAEMGKSFFEQFTKASHNYHLRAVVNVPLSGSWYGMLSLEHNWLGQGIRRSYLVDKAHYSVGFVGIGYDF